MGEWGKEALRLRVSSILKEHEVGGMFVTRRLVEMCQNMLRDHKAEVKRLRTRAEQAEAEVERLRKAAEEVAASPTCSSYHRLTLRAALRGEEE